MGAFTVKVGLVAALAAIVAGCRDETIREDAAMRSFTENRAKAERMAHERGIDLRKYEQP